MLTRKLLQLHEIDTQDNNNIRFARKQAIDYIENAIKELEEKAAQNEFLSC